MTVDPTPVPTETVLLNPGPVNVDPRVRKALGYPDVCHREPEVADLIRQVRGKIADVCGGNSDYTSVILSGSGTAALESAFSSIVPVAGKILILDNGHYGQRLRDIVTVHGIECLHLEFGLAKPLDLEDLERALVGDPAITHVGMVHHETSTGMLNPLRAVGEIVSRHDRSLAVDAISSLGSEEIDVYADHIDWLVGTANKCLEGLPGISFVCAPQARLEALSGGPRRSYYLDLHTHYTAQGHNGAPAFTPAVQVLYAFDRALDLMLEETVTQRGARYGAHAATLRAGLEERGFSPLLAPQHWCNSVTVAHLPAGITYRELHDALKQRGFVIYATQEELGATVRIATMGQISKSDLARFLVALDEALADLGAAVAAA